MRITVCKIKLNTSPKMVNIGPNAKLHKITMVTFTVLLAIKIVAKRRSGSANNFLIMLPLGESSSSSSCDGESEK